MSHRWQNMKTYFIRWSGDCYCFGMNRHLNGTNAAIYRVYPICWLIHPKAMAIASTKCFRQRMRFPVLWFSSKESISNKKPLEGSIYSLLAYGSRRVLMAAILAAQRWWRSREHRVLRENLSSFRARDGKARPAVFRKSLLAATFPPTARQIFMEIGTMTRFASQIASRIPTSRLIRLSFLAVVTIATSACTTLPTGEKETLGQALQRMDGSLENTISRLQNKTYDE